MVRWHHGDAAYTLFADRAVRWCEILAIDGPISLREDTTAPGVDRQGVAAEYHCGSHRLAIPWDLCRIKPHIRLVARKPELNEDLGVKAF